MTLPSKAGVRNMSARAPEVKVFCRMIFDHLSIGIDFVAAIRSKTTISWEISFVIDICHENKQVMLSRQSQILDSGQYHNYLTTVDLAVLKSFRKYQLTNIACLRIVPTVTAAELDPAIDSKSSSIDLVVHIAEGLETKSLVRSIINPLAP